MKLISAAPFPLKPAVHFAMNALLRLSDTSVREDKKVVLQLLIDLASLPLMDLQSAIKQLETQFNNPRMLNELLIYGRTLVRKKSESVNIPMNTVIFEIPSKELATLLSDVFEFFHNECAVYHIDELAAGSGLWSLFLTQHLSTANHLDFKYKVYDKFIPSPIVEKLSIADYTRSILPTIHSSKPRIIFMTWPDSECQGELLILLQQITQLKAPVHIVMLAQSWCDASLNKTFLSALKTLEFSYVCQGYRSLSQADGLTFDPWTRHRESNFVVITPAHLKQNHIKFETFFNALQAKNTFFFDVVNQQDSLQSKMKELCMFKPNNLSLFDKVLSFETANGRPIFIKKNGSGFFYSPSKHATPEQPYGPYADYACIPSDPTTQFTREAGEYMQEIERVFTILK